MTVKCPFCQHKNIEGVLFCSDCGFPLWDQDKKSTRQIEENGDSLAMKAGWGTSSFHEENEIILHIQDVKTPIRISSLNSELLIGREDNASGIKPGMDLSDHGALEKGVSRIHAALRRRADHVVLVDLNSANGTFLNGQKLKAEHPHTLRDGDEIRMGKLVLHVYFK